MPISNNIAKYRKKKGYTQEQLGKQLGVTNQAVSKWESGISMPDVMLLPLIATELGISLEQLYGIEEQSKERRVKADDFPKKANQNLLNDFQRHSRLNFDAEKLNDQKSLLCLSNVEGGVYASKHFSVLDCTFKQNESENVFSVEEIASALRKLSDRNVRKILVYVYREAFQNDEAGLQEFYISDIANACSISEDDALEAMEKLVALRMFEVDIEDYVTKYYFLQSRAFFALTVYRTAELLIRESFVYMVLRDPVTISDYAFEKLW